MTPVQEHMGTKLRFIPHPPHIRRTYHIYKYVSTKERTHSKAIQKRDTVDIR